MVSDNDDDNEDSGSASFPKLMTITTVPNNVDNNDSALFPTILTIPMVSDKDDSNNSAPFSSVMNVTTVLENDKFNGGAPFPTTKTIAKVPGNGLAKGEKSSDDCVPERLPVSATSILTVCGNTVQSHIDSKNCFRW